MYFVYKITNLLNEKIYFGYTGRTVDQRWRSHKTAARNGSPYRFHSAIRKYGVDPWTVETVLDTEDIDLAKVTETQHILQFDTMIKGKGYNAKPGGCGGWIVPAEKYLAWRAFQAISNVGANNSNASPMSNDDLVDLAVHYTSEFGRIPSLGRLVEYGRNQNKRVPKSFQNYRFNGDYQNLVHIVEEKTNMSYEPLHRDEQHRKKLSAAIKGRRWYHNDTIGKSALFQEINQPSDGWQLGKKRYD